MALCDKRPHLEAALNRLVYERSFFLARRLQYIIYYGIFIAGMTDADAQAPELFGGRDARRCPSNRYVRPDRHPASAGSARRQIQLVMNHKNVFGLDFIVVAQGSNSLATGIHVGLGIEQPQLGIALTQSRAKSVESRLRPLT